MKALFYTDAHLSGQTPRHRVDNYQETVAMKLRELYEVAERQGCDFVCFGGDFFHTHRIFSYEVISSAMDVLCKSKLKTYMCLGEHDLYAHNPKSFPTSTLAFMLRHCGNVEILWEPKEVSGVVLYAKHEWETMDAAMAVKVNNKKPSILLCHELLCNKKMPFDIINVNDLTNCPYDVVLSGDLHDGFGVTKVGKTTFANPGSLVRRTTADAGRWPQAAIVEYNGVGFDVNYYRLACPKPSGEVFGETLAEVMKDSVTSVQASSAFADGLLELEAESSDVHELIAKAGVQAGLSQDVLKYLATKKGDEQ